MENNWNPYWEKEDNRPYWLQPDQPVVAVINMLDKTKVKDVLDLGCGIGRHTFLLAETGFSVTAVDFSAEALSTLRKSQAEKKYQIRIINGDFTQDLFPENTFDFILSYNVLYHDYRQDFETAIRQIHRWLRSEGMFFFTCPTQRDGKFGSGEMIAPNTYKPLNSIHPGDIHYFASEADLRDLLHGFNIIFNNIDDHYWDNNRVRQLSSYWQIMARKML
jgi:tellurite methyltransferase